MKQSAVGLGSGWRPLAAGAVTLAVVMLGAPLSASAAPSGPLVIDCADLDEYIDRDGFYRYLTLPLRAGETAVISQTNCDSYQAYPPPAGAPSPDPAGGVPAANLTVEVGDGFYLWNANALVEDGYDYLNVSVVEISDDNPSGQLLATQAATLPVNAQQLVVEDNTGGDGDHNLGDNDDCALEADPIGNHVYSLLPITITAAGDFTFRGLFSTPKGGYAGAAEDGRFEALDEYDPLQDPFLAVYSTFDPANPDVGVIGCNDDIENWLRSSQGQVIEAHQPRFNASLTPGQYTLVLMTYDSVSSAELAAGALADGRTFAVGDRSTTFDLWGPAGGLYLGHGPAPTSTTTTASAALARTGVAQSPVLWIGGALVLVVGAGLLIYRRRHRAS